MSSYSWNVILDILTTNENRTNLLLVKAWSNYIEEYTFEWFSDNKLLVPAFCR